MNKEMQKLLKAINDKRMRSRALRTMENSTRQRQQRGTQRVTGKV